MLRIRVPRWLPNLLVGFVCAATILSELLSRGWELRFSPLGPLMHNPEALPVFGYRLLLPSMARGLQALVPALTDFHCFLATQVVAVAATVYLSGKWASLFLPRFGSLLGYVMLALMLCPTFGYWTFYDVALVGFWTACLLLLNGGRFSAYLAVFAVAVLNHENILLLVPAAVLYGWRRMKPRDLVLFALCQIALFVGVRQLAAALVPAGAITINRLPQNLVFWRTYTPAHLIASAAVLVPWWLLACAGWKAAPPLVRYSAISLPGLLIVTTLFGRYVEARQFDAFIPSCVALVACWLGRQTGRAQQGAAEFSSASCQREEPPPAAPTSP